MEALHRGDGADLEEVWLRCPGGLVCISRDLTMFWFSLTCQLNRGWMRWYRHGRGFICTPPDSSASGSSGESLLRSGSSPFGSPILAEPAMVCGPGSPTLPWRVALLSMGDSHPAGSLLSQVGGSFFRPCPELCNLLVWPLRGHNS